MVADPSATAVTVPDALTVAIAALLLLQVPAGTVSVNGVVLPTQIDEEPLMAAGANPMFTAAVAADPQPVV